MHRGVQKVDGDDAEEVLSDNGFLKDQRSVWTMGVKPTKSIKLCMMMRMMS